MSDFVQLQLVSAAWFLVATQCTGVWRGMARGVAIGPLFVCVGLIMEKLQLI